MDSTPKTLETLEDFRKFAQEQIRKRVNSECQSVIARCREEITRLRLMGYRPEFIYERFLSFCDTIYAEYSDDVPEEEPRYDWQKRKDIND